MSLAEQKRSELTGRNLGNALPNRRTAMGLMAGGAVAAVYFGAGANSAEAAEGRTAVKDFSVHARHLKALARSPFEVGNLAAAYYLLGRFESLDELQNDPIGRSFRLDFQRNKDFGELGVLFSHTKSERFALLGLSLEARLIKNYFDRQHGVSDASNRESFVGEFKEYAELALIMGQSAAPETRILSKVIVASGIWEKGKDEVAAQADNLAQELFSNPNFLTLDDLGKDLITPYGSVDSADWQKKLTDHCKNDKRFDLFEPYLPKVGDKSICEIEGADLEREWGESPDTVDLAISTANDAATATIPSEKSEQYEEKTTSIASSRILSFDHIAEQLYLLGPEDDDRDIADALLNEAGEGRRDILTFNSEKEQTASSLPTMTVEEKLQLTLSTLALAEAMGADPDMVRYATYATKIGYAAAFGSVYAAPIAAITCIAQELSFQANKEAAEAQAEYNRIVLEALKRTLAGINLIIESDYKYYKQLQTTLDYGFDTVITQLNLVITAIHHLTELTVEEFQNISDTQDETLRMVLLNRNLIQTLRQEFHAAVKDEKSEKLRDLLNSLPEWNGKTDQTKYPFSMIRNTLTGIVDKVLFRSISDMQLALAADSSLMDDLTQNLPTLEDRPSIARGVDSSALTLQGLTKLGLVPPAKLPDGLGQIDLVDQHLYQPLVSNSFSA